VKTVQEALEFFCKHFNLYIDCIDYCKEESGYYCKLKATEPPFEGDTYYCGTYGTFLCYIRECENGYSMRDMNLVVPGEWLELNQFIKYIENMLFDDGWVLTKEKEKYIWQ